MPLLDRRPVPTPCRAGVFCVDTSSGAPASCHTEELSEANPDSGVSQIDESLVTLLEEAAAHSDQWAFLAATMLDTLQDHFTDVASSPASANQLRLADHIPLVRVHDLTTATVDLGPFFASAGRLVLPGSWTLAHELPPDIARFAGLQHILTGHPLPSGQLGEAHLYTDGSYNGEVASWAFAVIVEGDSACHLHGWASGQVSVQSENPWFIGALEHTPLTGEQSALVCAILWALQSPFYTRLRFFSDCLVALHQTTGRFGSSCASGLSTVCRHLFQALEGVATDLPA